jgi:hypothetical protein
MLPEAAATLKVSPAMNFTGSIRMSNNLQRKRKPLIALFVIALLVLLACSAVSNALQAQEKPNILILYADDLGFGDLSCYNAESKIPTPNLDGLATSGMRFTDGHSSSGICTPSR